MKRAFSLLSLFLLVAMPGFAQQTMGTIRGHVRVTGELPGNPVIRMGADPMCARINAGKRPVQEVVEIDDKGDLASVFVRLQGDLPKTTSPARPARTVTIDQRGCIYGPRVIGMQLGQTLQIRNDDPLSHNVHIISKYGNNFSATTPTTGGVSTFTPKAEEVMLRVGCDFHRWMTAYIGVVANPYFAVSGEKGTFEIANVPPGTYTIQAWHELYGPVTKKVKVTAGGVTNVDFIYMGNVTSGHTGNL
jgi:hypothetical protein